MPKNKIQEAHQQAKRKLIDFINHHYKTGMDYETFTIGFARRATAYKRWDLVFYDMDRLNQVSERAGDIQFVFSGKAHPEDEEGKRMIHSIINKSKESKGKIKIVYLENYGINLAKLIIPGVDLWLNTPRKPQEASGTSGMKAAHNGVPSLSILDGWWIEGCIEGYTGWPIGTGQEAENDDDNDARSLYEKLEHTIIPLFYNDNDRWLEIMRFCIAINASFFNSHRMLMEYVLNGYLD